MLQGSIHASKADVDLFLDLNFDPGHQRNLMRAPPKAPPEELTHRERLEAQAAREAKEARGFEQRIYDQMSPLELN